jgi:hypothetical protein
MIRPVKKLQNVRTVISAMKIQSWMFLLNTGLHIQATTQQTIITYISLSHCYLQLRILQKNGEI